MDTSKNYIIQQIDNLKNDIQKLMDEKKRADNKFIVNKYDEDKRVKMEELKRLTEKLKQIHKKERDDKQIKQDLATVGKTLDSLDFRNAKKKNSSMALTKAKRDKEIRQQAREKYLEYLKLEEDYFKLDPKALPGMLFLHQTIIKEYGICPYITLNDTCEVQQETEENDDQQDQQEEIKNITDITYNKRLEWLGLQKDNGSLYYKLYDTLINKKELQLVKDEKLGMEEKIGSFIKEILSDSQQELLEKCINFIEEYVQCNIKTKRLKERYKSCINNLSILYSEVNIKLHSYLSVKYNLHIDVNILEVKENPQNVIFSDQFDNLVTEYQNLNEVMKTKEKFLLNTIKNLKQDLCSFLTDNAKFMNSCMNNNINIKNKSSYTQVGKYFKRWILLTQEERLERFESFALFYVHKFLLDKDIIDHSSRDDTVTTLSDLLKSAFSSKKMVYRDFVWNTTRGLIENVKILHYDRELGFVLKYTKQIREKEPGTDNIVKKRVSVRTIITKESEKVINEDLLYFIVKRVQNGSVAVSKEDKEAFAERIKLKLKIKKLTVNDKMKIFEKYEEIFDVVNNNKV